jgi:acyl dehydratase
MRKILGKDQRGRFYPRGEKKEALMPKRMIQNLEELKKMTGQEVGVSDWHPVTQQAINLFADATLDHQWIHIDVERAKRESPFGGPIAHGYYTLSLAPYLLANVFDVKEKKMGVNYGLNKLRFTAPVPVPSRVRVRATLAQIEEIKGGVQATFNLQFEVEGKDKPACVAEAIYRYYA